MKKLLLSIVGTLAVVIIPMASASAQATGGVFGHVTQGGADVGGASVSATCETATGSGATDSNGDYTLSLSPEGVCQPGDIVTVTAHKGAASGQTKQAAGTDPSLFMGVEIESVNVNVVPELGALTGVGAAIFGGAAFIVVRRKHVNQN